MMHRNKIRSSIGAVTESEERPEITEKAEHRPPSSSSANSSSSTSCQLENSTNSLNNGLTLNITGPGDCPAPLDAMLNHSKEELSTSDRHERFDIIPLSVKCLVLHYSLAICLENLVHQRFLRCTISDVLPSCGGPSALPPRFGAGGGGLPKRNHSDGVLCMSQYSPPDHKVHRWLEAARRNSDPTPPHVASAPFLCEGLHSGHNSKSEGTDSVGSSYHSDSGELTGSIGNVHSSNDLQTAKEILSQESFAYSTASSSPKESSKSASNGISSDTSSRSIPPGEADKISFSSVGKNSKNSSSDKKKRSSNWYNQAGLVLSPTYKSRCEDFKKVFKGISHDERLIVDYSCALHKDILIQGRLYVTQNWICFYANIFRWETVLTIRCKDIATMTKEKTARVIPNAIQICTKDEKYNFSSLNHRDKCYLMLFRVWQNALCDQQMTPQELWQWVHHSYGDELGLHSSDEDYTQPTLEDEVNFQAVLLQDEEKLINTSNGPESVPTMQVTKYSKDDERVDFIDAPIPPSYNENDIVTVFDIGCLQPKEFHGCL
ncbi:hypothetical protein CAPTEDRAFT_227616 [Capitella teleta]|uniref:GRAM domain-containing protein n=1 Tax=Capitella teleta TaxID=283909 RepID=R7UJ77_CAPTE|nr:hypothetical protein CAPTEDRAFT_227616 [Capitella teleta]|eukprot:ELU06594.1 hypothetical protein CAPTEDRAFT_227616 [Capitella teleta]